VDIVLSLNSRMIWSGSCGIFVILKGGATKFTAHRDNHFAAVAGYKPTLEVGSRSPVIGLH
jgi:hypothetical protein